MRKSLFGFFFLFMISLSVTAQGIFNQLDSAGKRQGPWLIYGWMKKDKQYPDSAIVEKGYYSDNRKTGYWDDYYPSGRLRSEMLYVNGRSGGCYNSFREKGKPEEVSAFYGSHFAGDYILFYENGYPRQVFCYDQLGRREGKQVYYLNDSSVVPYIEAWYHEGKENGYYREFSRDGHVAILRYYRYGVLDQDSVKTFQRIADDPAYAGGPPWFGQHSYRKDTVQAEGYFFEGNLWMGRKYYFRKGSYQPLRIAVYENGAWVKDDSLNVNNFPVGLRPSGKIRPPALPAAKVPGAPGCLNARDSLGRAQGYWQLNTGMVETMLLRNMDQIDPDAYSPAQLIEEGRFVNGEREGTWILYYPNGKRKRESVYQNGWLKKVLRSYYADERPEAELSWEAHPFREITSSYFDSAGLVREKTWTDSLGHLLRKESCIYDENWILLLRDVQDAAGRAIATVYSPKGKIIQEIPHAAYEKLQPLKGAMYGNLSLFQYPLKVSSPSAIGGSRNKSWSGEGERTLVNADGLVSMKGEFHQYRLVNGEQRLYDASRQLIRIRCYKAGKYVGDAPIPDQEDEQPSGHKRFHKH